MIVCALVRLEEQPPRRSLAANHCRSARKVTHTISSDAVKNGARRTGDDCGSAALVVEIVERRRELAVHLDDRLGVDLSRRPPPRDVPVRQNLIRAVPGSPCSCCKGPNDAATILVAMDATQPRGTLEGVRLLDDASHGLPVQAGRRRPAEHREARVCGFVLEVRPPFNDWGHNIPDSIEIRRPACTRERHNVFRFDVADDLPGAQTSTDPEANRPVPPGLPRDVRVQAYESRIADEVVLLCQLSHKFRCQERRAHAAEAVGVIDANPEDHNRPRSPFTPKKPRLPRFI